VPGLGSPALRLFLLASPHFFPSPAPVRDFYEVSLTICRFPSNLFPIVSFSISLPSSGRTAEDRRNFPSFGGVGVARCLLPPVYSFFPAQEVFPLSSFLVDLATRCLASRFLCGGCFYMSLSGRSPTRSVSFLLEGLFVDRPALFLIPVGGTGSSFSLEDFHILPFFVFVERSLIQPSPCFLNLPRPICNFPSLYLRRHRERSPSPSFVC